MKVNVSEDTARKTLAILPADTTDQDIRQLRDRLETGLKAVTAAGTLQPAELDALIVVSRFALSVHLMQGRPDPAPIYRLKDQLNTAIPKLEALLARRTAEAESRG